MSGVQQQDKKQSLCSFVPDEVPSQHHQWSERAPVVKHNREDAFRPPALTSTHKKRRKSISLLLQSVSTRRSLVTWRPAPVSPLKPNEAEIREAATVSTTVEPTHRQPETPGGERRISSARRAPTVLWLSVRGPDAHFKPQQVQLTISLCEPRTTAAPATQAWNPNLQHYIRAMRRSWAKHQQERIYSKCLRR